MKKCKIHSTAQNREADAVIIDGHVLVAAPRLETVTPAKVIDGVCYYPPRYGAWFVRNMDYAPFSVECEWGEFGACWKDYYYHGECDKIDDPRPTWAIHYEVEDIPEKWGYCYVPTGEIREAPQWERCEDCTNDGFGRVKGMLYGVKNDSMGDPSDVFLWPKYRDIVFIEDDQLEYCTILLVQSESGVWGAFWGNDWEPDWQTIPAVRMEWDGIWYEDGFFTVLRRGEDGREEYALLNAFKHEPFVDHLTERPSRYLPERWADYDGEVRFASYYLINREEELGLVCAYPENGGELMQDPTIIKHPVYTYNHLCRRISRDMQETEIAYYARLMSRTPKHFPKRGGDGWDAVPENLHDIVREVMAKKGWIQPETVADLEQTGADDS